MSAFSIWHWLILALVLVTAVAPAWLIVRKAGYPGVLSLLTFVPILNFVMIWIFALSTWPVTKKAASQA